MKQVRTEWNSRRARGAAKQRPGARGWGGAREGARPAPGSAADRPAVCLGDWGQGAIDPGSSGPDTEWLHSQRLESLGALASGVAHDLGNLLTVMMAECDLLSEALGSDPRQEHARELLETVERASSLTQPLLAFSRKQPPRPEPLELDEAVGDAARLLRRLLPAPVEMVVRLEAVGARVLADAGEIGQIVMNLGINARDAMPGCGRLTIGTAQCEMSARTAARLDAPAAGPYAILCVRDTGCGMDARTQSRVFEPFFTTKPAGRGTGMGLATVAALVRRSGGCLTVRSSFGRGTTFSLYLPRVGRGSAPDAAQVPADCGSETVMAVDDDPALRSVIARALRVRGYTVLETPGGEEALGLAAGHPGPIHLLLADVVMPRMSGLRLAEKMARLRPEARLLLMSGYPHESVARQAPPSGFLLKPFSPADLARRVREILDHNPQHGPVVGPCRQEKQNVP